MNHNTKPILVMASLALASAGQLSSQVIFDADPSIPNFNPIHNGVGTAPAITGTLGDITVTHSGSTNSSGLASIDNINTLLGRALTVDDTIVVTIAVASTGNIGFNGIELGVSPNGTGFRPADNLLFRIDDNGATAGLSSGNAEGLSTTAAGFGLTEASLSDGFTMTLTADVDGFSFSFAGVDDGAGATSPSFDASYGTSNFLDIFSTAHIYCTVQQGTPTVYSEFSIGLLDTTDSDNDGMFDSYEIANGLDPLVDDAALDSDIDGLTNIFEFNFVPQLPAGNPDADGDDLLDGEEVNGTLNSFPNPSTNPFSTDSDGDGLTDGEEVLSDNGSVSNPNSDDTDDDLLLDAFEVNNGLDPNSDAGDDGNEGDPDGDTVDNFNEQLFNLDPNNPDSDEDGLNDGGDFSMGQLGELDTTNSLFPDQVTDPSDPDTDDDKILDGEEVFAGDDGFITDPNSVDSDSDGFPDPYEILAGTDPSAANGSAIFPTYASVTWSVTAIDDYLNDGSLVTGEGLDSLRIDGTLLYAENYNGNDAIANGITFAGVGNESTPRCSDNVLTLIRNNSGQNFYAGSVAEFNPLLDTIFFQGDGGHNDPTSALILLQGLTAGENYYIQFGTADDRAGSRIGRYLEVDTSFGGNDATALVGPDNTIFGGPDNPGLMFTGVFTATGETQQISILQRGSDGAPAAVQLQFLQVRLDDGTLPQTGDIEVVDCSFNGTAFDVTFNNLTVGADYELRRSETLNFDSPDAVADSITAGATSETLSDDSPPSSKAFYQLFEVTP